LKRCTKSNALQRFGYGTLLSLTFIKKTMNWIKYIFSKKYRKQCAISGVVGSITCGTPDEKGFADLYLDGKETNTQLFLWDKKEVEELQEIGRKIHEENRNK